MAEPCGRAQALPDPEPGLLTRTASATPFSSGERKFKPQAQESRTMAINAPACPRLHTPRRTLKLFQSLALYRAMRPFTGPALAWRLSFAWRAAA